MSDDPYKVLGVDRSASQDDIRAAYRKLAKSHHPDLNPGNKASEDRFKAISQAYNLLSDPDQRARFDRGEIDASGTETPRQRQQYYRTHADAEPGAGNPYQGGFGFGGAEDLSDLFADLFSGARRQRGTRGDGFGQGARAGAGMRGPDIQYSLTIDFLEAVNGARKRVTMADGKLLDLTIPPGTEEGQTLRLRGKGHPGPVGGEAGDALIKVSVSPHPWFTREDRNLRLTLPVTLDEAVLGARVQVPTPGGPVTVTVPRHSNTGRVLRLRGKGVPASGGKAAGDLLVTLKVVLPGETDSELEEFLKSWSRRGKDDPRKAAGM